MIFTLTGLGFVIAWRMESTAGFHAIMNLLLVPMWMISGALATSNAASESRIKLPKGKASSESTYVEARGFAPRSRGLRPRAITRSA